jgi:hypothetical protein
MNKKGNVIIAGIIGFVCITAVVNGFFDFHKGEDGKIEKVTLTEGVKNDGRIIWCKMQGRKDCN